MKRLLILSIVFFLSQQSVSIPRAAAEGEHPADEEPSYTCNQGPLHSEYIYPTMCNLISENEENDNSS